MAEIVQEGRQMKAQHKRIHDVHKEVVTENLKKDLLGWLKWLVLSRREGNNDYLHLTCTPDELDAVHGTANNMLKLVGITLYCKECNVIDCKEHKQYAD